jgi:hypothetical protein
MTKEPTPRQAEVYGCFDGLSDIHPDKSTDFLLQITADAMNCSVNEVALALQAYTVSLPASPGDGGRQ